MLQFAVCSGGHAKCISECPGLQSRMHRRQVAQQQAIHLLLIGKANINTFLTHGSVLYPPIAARLGSLTRTITLLDQCSQMPICVLMQPVQPGAYLHVHLHVKHYEYLSD